MPKQRLSPTEREDLEKTLVDLDEQVEQLTALQSIGRNVDGLLLANNQSRAEIVVLLENF